MKVFNVMNYELKFSEEELIHYRILADLEITGKIVKEELSDIYLEKDAKYFLENIESDIIKKISELLERLTKAYFHDNGIYLVTAEDFLGKEIRLKYLTELSQLIREYQKKIGIKEDARLYREERKDSRGRIIGGGFGIGGAVKGMAVAGAANMVTGMLHSAWNMIDGMSTNYEIDMEISELVESNKSKIIEAVKEDVISFYSVLINLLQKHFRNIGDEIDYIENERKADKLIENIDKGVVGDEHLESCLCQALRYAPHKSFFYERIYDEFRDYDGGLESMSLELGVNTRIPEWKKIEEAVEEFWGEYIDEVEDIEFNTNLYNEFYLEIIDKEENIFDKLRKIYIKKSDVLIDTFINDKCPSQLKKVLEYYKLYEDEKPLYFYDSAVFNYGSNGIFLTTMGLRMNEITFDYKEVLDVKFDGQLKIKGKKLPISFIFEEKYLLFMDFIKILACIMLYSYDWKKELKRISKIEEGLWNKTEEINDKQEFSKKEDIKIEKLSDFEFKERVNKLYKQMESEEIKKQLILVDDDRAEKKIKNIKNEYAKLEREEEAIVLYDDTFFGGAKEGFLITTKNLYLHNLFSEAVKIEREYIKEIGVVDTGIQLNNSILMEIKMLNDSDKPALIEFLKKIFTI